MNKEFIKKIIKSKKLEFEAIMEILPESMKKRVENLGKEALDLGKEIISDFVKDEELIAVKKGRNTENTENLKKKIKKVKVEF